MCMRAPSQRCKTDGACCQKPHDGCRRFGQMARTGLRTYLHTYTHMCSMYGVPGRLSVSRGRRSLRSGISGVSCSAGSDFNSSHRFVRRFQPLSWAGALVRSQRNLADMAFSDGK